MFYYIYKITNLVNKKIYIGVHQTKNLNDEYFGSGMLLNRAIKKYGKENFKKEILEFCSSEEEMFLKEKQIVNKDFVKLNNTYNLNEGGNGSFSYINSLPSQGHKQGQNKKASILGHLAFKEKLKDLEFSEKFSKKMSDIVKNQYLNGERINPAYNLKWVSNLELKQSRYVDKNTIEDFLNNGWILGRKFKHSNSGKKYKKRN
jgi:hypothetical protein